MVQKFDVPRFARCGVPVGLRHKLRRLGCPSSSFHAHIVDDIARGPKGIPLTVSQDAVCAYCNGAKHPTNTNGIHGPAEFHNRMVIHCPRQGFVARMNHTTCVMEVLPEHVGHVQLSAPREFVPRVRGGRGGLFNYHAPINHRVPPLAIAAPPPVVQAPAAAPARAETMMVTLSLQMMNQHTTHTVKHVIPLTEFSLASLPNHVQHQLHYAEIVPGTAEILLHNRWRSLVVHRSLDVSSIRAEPVLSLRGISSVFPLKFARDMAEGLRAYALACDQDPDASPVDVFKNAFNGSPWPGADEIFEAMQLWNALPGHLRDRYSIAPRTHEFTWARVVGAADHARYSSPAPVTKPRGFTKRKRADSSEPEILDPAPPRVKREPVDGNIPARKRKRTAAEDSDDSDVEIVEGTSPRPVKREPRDEKLPSLTRKRTTGAGERNDDREGLRSDPIDVDAWAARSPNKR